jgi:hypothetical protein
MNEFEFPRLYHTLISPRLPDSLAFMEACEGFSPAVSSNTDLSA